jgi:hypothetical protein
MRKYRNVAERLASRERNIVCLTDFGVSSPAAGRSGERDTGDPGILEQKCDLALSRDEFTISFVHQHVEDGERSVGQAGVSHSRAPDLGPLLRTVIRTFSLSGETRSVMTSAR